VAPAASQSPAATNFFFGPFLGIVVYNGHYKAGAFSDVLERQGPVGNLDTQPVWPLAAYFGLVVLAIVGTVALSYVLGQRHRDRQTADPYEGGVISSGSARLRLAADFYLVAVFFVVFDLEAVFIFAWAVSARRLGWAGFAEVLVFIAVLLAALAYLWKTGALEWGRKR
jgi:NADH-quinone oxidoreductase subunit A